MVPTSWPSDPALGGADARSRRLRQRAPRAAAPAASTPVRRPAGARTGRAVPAVRRSRRQPAPSRTRARDGSAGSATVPRRRARRRASVGRRRSRRVHRGHRGGVVVGGLPPVAAGGLAHTRESPRSGWRSGGSRLCAACEPAVTLCGEGRPRDVRNNPPHVRVRSLLPAHGALARADRVELVVTLAVLTAVLVGVGWLITHPLKSTMAHESSVNRWFADQRTSGLTEPGRRRHVPRPDAHRCGRPGRARRGLRGVEAHLVAGGVRRRARRRARPVLPGRHVARPAAAPARAHPAVGARGRPQLPVGPHRHGGRHRRRDRGPALGLHPRCRRRCSSCSS